RPWLYGQGRSGWSTRGDAVAESAARPADPIPIVLGGEVVHVEFRPSDSRRWLAGERQRHPEQLHRFEHRDGVLPACAGRSADAWRTISRESLGAILVLQRQ